MSNSVNPQITDSVTQTSSHVLGLGPAFAAISAYLGQTQSQTVLFANMVNQQQQSAMLAMTMTTQNVKKLLGVKALKKGDDAQLGGGGTENNPNPVSETDSGTVTQAYYQQNISQRFPDKPQPPVVT